MNLHLNSVNDALMLREGFRKYHSGETVSDDEIIEILRFLEPMERDGWVLDSRFTFFVNEIRTITTSLRGFQQQRITQGRWNPQKDQPAFLRPRELANESQQH
jgi:hypothetical protein